MSDFNPISPIIFISYRNADTSDFAHRFYNELSKHYSTRDIFFDKRGIGDGEVISTKLETTIELCQVMLVIIGNKWLEEFERRDKNQETDYVRYEIRKGLNSHSVIVIPVLVGDTKVFDLSKFPDIRTLFDIRAPSIHLDPKQFIQDVYHLAERIKERVNRFGGISTITPWPVLRFGTVIDLAQQTIRINHIWTQLLEGVEERWKNAIERQVSIQILLIDPDSIFAEARNTDLGWPEGKVKKRIQESIDMLLHLYEKYGPNIAHPHIPNFEWKWEVKFYNGNLGLCYYWFDNFAFATAIPHHMQSIEAPHLFIRDVSSGDYGKWIQDDFNRIWSKESNRKLNFETGEIYPPVLNDPYRKPLNEKKS